MPSGTAMEPTAAPRPTGTPGQAGGKARPAATSTPSPMPTPSGPTPTPAPTVGQPSRVAISTTVTLKAAGGSKVSGLAVFLYVGYSNKTSVIVTALHLPALSRHAGALRQGTCAMPGSVVVPFPAIKAGRDGRGVTNAFVPGNATKRHLAVFVYAGPAGVSSRVLACGTLH